MPTAFLRWNKLFDMVGEEDDAHLVLIAAGRAGQRGGHLGQQFALTGRTAAKVKTAADIDQQHDGEFALFLKHLHVRTTKARRHIPVNIAHVIAGVVFAHFGKRHTAPLEGRMVFACEEIVDRTARLDLDIPYFLE